MLCFDTCLQSHVALSKFDTNPPEEVIGRCAAGEDPDEVVGDYLVAAIDRENDGVLFELHRIRFKDDFDFPGTNAVFDPFRIPFLDATETLLPIGEGDVVATLIC